MIGGLIHLSLAAINVLFFPNPLNMAAATFCFGVAMYFFMEETSRR